MGDEPFAVRSLLENRHKIATVVPAVQFRRLSNFPGHLTSTAQVSKRSTTINLVDSLNKLYDGCLTGIGWPPELVNSRHPNYRSNTVVGHQDGVWRECAADAFSVIGQPAGAIALDNSPNRRDVRRTKAFSFHCPDGVDYGGQRQGSDCGKPAASECSHLGTPPHRTSTMISRWYSGGTLETSCLTSALE